MEPRCDHTADTCRFDIPDGTNREGSWGWSDYDFWLEQRSGERKPAPSRLGSRRFGVIGEAPGTYVLAD